MTRTAGIRRLAPTIAIAVCAAMLAACAGLPGGSDDSQAQQSEQERQATRHELNQGYSLLYSAVGSLSNTNKTFYVKVESDSLQRVIGGASDYAGKVKSQLERITKDYPAVKIDLDPLPEIEKRKRSSISEDTLKSLAPVVGKSGPAFERKLLLAASGALNQLEYLCQVMAEQEPVDSLKQFLAGAQQQFGEHYDQVVKLLNEQYFKDDTYEPGKR